MTASIILVSITILIVCRAIAIMRKELNSMDDKLYKLEFRNSVLEKELESYFISGLGIRRRRGVRNEGKRFNKHDECKPINLYRGLIR